MANLRHLYLHEIHKGRSCVILISNKDKIFPSLTLLKVTAVLGAEFIDWIEDNYYKFRHCNAMWNML